MTRPAPDLALDHDRAATGALDRDRSASGAHILTVRGDAVHARTDRLAGEEPLEIRAAGPGQEPVSVAVTMRTPGFEEDLAVGFLYTEGLVVPEDLAGFAYGDPVANSFPDNRVTVRLRHAFDAARIAGRNFVATASCGICGKASLEQIEVRCAAIPPGPTVARAVLTSLPDTLRAAQALFSTTGGLHGCGLFDTEGRLVVAREDVGRHNALDKIVGAAVRDGAVPLRERILLVSGRVSFELVQKAAMAGAPILCAVSAPSDLAVRAAERLGLTLVGFLRGDTFNVYAHPERIAGLDALS